VEEIISTNHIMPRRQVLTSLEIRVESLEEQVKAMTDVLDKIFEWIMEQNEEKDGFLVVKSEDD